MERLTHAREAETKYVGEQNELEITKAREMANIETEKFNNMVQAIGSDTISTIVTSSPEMQVWIACVCVYSPCTCIACMSCVRRWYVCMYISITVCVFHQSICLSVHVCVYTVSRKRI